MLYLVVQKADTADVLIVVPYDWKQATLVQLYVRDYCCCSWPVRAYLATVMLSCC